jgi:hypothetical protein
MRIHATGGVSRRRTSSQRPRKKQAGAHTWLISIIPTRWEYFFYGAGTEQSIMESSLETCASRIRGVTSCPQHPSHRNSRSGVKYSIVFHRERRSGKAMSMRDNHESSRFRWCSWHVMGSNWRRMMPDEAARCRRWVPGDIMHLYRHALLSYVQQPSGHWLKNEQEAAGR